MTKPTIAFIIGTRPDFIRISEVFDILDNSPECNVLFVHSGQHYSSFLSSDILKQIGVREPDYNLGIGGSSPMGQAASILKELEQFCDDVEPDACIFLGDTNTVIGSIAVARSNKSSIIHIEAGMRSHAIKSPEEVNRITCDHLSDYLFAYMPQYKKHLVTEGIDESKIFVVGNIIVDILNKFLPIAQDASTQYDNRFIKHGTPYGIMTVHRQENVEDPAALRNIIESVSKNADKFDLPIIWPIYPRTMDRMKEFGISGRGLSPNLLMKPTYTFLEFLKLESNANIELTDSGTNQEVSTILGIPSIVFREYTERPECIETGYSRLVGSDRDAIDSAFEDLYGTKEEFSGTDVFGTGGHSAKICDILLDTSKVDLTERQGPRTEEDIHCLARKR